MSKNLGMDYEDYINKILSDKNLLPSDCEGNDSGFIHQGTTYFLEVKNKNAPDFGQKRFIWNENDGWKWSIEDNITEIYDKFDVLDLIDKDFIPRRYTISEKKITYSDKRYDQTRIKESGIDIENSDLIHLYYERKDCYYIQKENSGFFYLKDDVANLDVPQFNPKIRLRLRAKTHHSEPISAYSFFVVINIAPYHEVSPYDIEESVGKFPDTLG